MTEFKSGNTTRITKAGALPMPVRTPAGRGRVPQALSQQVDGDSPFPSGHENPGQEASGVVTGTSGCCSPDHTDMGLEYPVHGGQTRSTYNKAQTSPSPAPGEAKAHRVQERKSIRFICSGQHVRLYKVSLNGLKKHISQ